jgi:histidyl-tRNA synthetase
MKPSLAKGTRDYTPQVMKNRTFIFNTIRRIFERYGYQEIQTPTFENLTTLTGKYGEEGDRLIFKILNSGDYLAKAPEALLQDRQSVSLIPHISEKALRYDLTVPFARYVVMHQHELTWPFKRYQIQPVWRADRPQKGRYREFYQCDVDVVGSPSLLNEAEFILIYHEAFLDLGLKDFTIKINNRKILTGIAERLGKPSLLVDLTVAIDKLDKIGIQGVHNELLSKGFESSDLDHLAPLFALSGSNEAKLDQLSELLKDSSTGLKGIEELREVFSLVTQLTGNRALLDQFVEVDVTLARGLNYYTGCIFEVKTNEVAMGSIGGGGRYDDLTSMFGLKDLTGVGISFGADRIYDVLEALDLFPSSNRSTTQVLITQLDEESQAVALPLLHQLRKAGVAAELYPVVSKMKKQMTYADDREIPYVLFLGEEERKQGVVTLKRMDSGEQQTYTPDALIEVLSP